MNSCRIIIFGSGGSGKSTLAKTLAARLGLHHVEVDSLAFQDRYVRVDSDVLHARLDEALAGERWVVEGLHPKELGQMAMPLAHLFIWLDMPSWRIAARLVSRLLRALVLREESHGRRVTARSLSQDFKWLSKSVRSVERRRVHARNLSKQANAYGVDVIHLRTSSEIDQFLARIPRV